MSVNFLLECDDDFIAFPLQNEVAGVALQFLTQTKAQ